MTKKHFEAIASIINLARCEYHGGDGAVFSIADAMADMFAVENPRFDRETFLTACGYPGMV